MTYKHSPISFTKETMFYRYKNGIKLILPQDIQKNKSYCSDRNTTQLITDLFKIKCNVCFSDENSHFLAGNETLIESLSCISEKDLLGKSVFDFAKRESALLARKNDIEVINNNSFKMYDEIAALNNGINELYLSIKMPLYVDQNKIIGLLCCSASLNRHSLAEYLLQITKFYLLNPKSSSANNLLPGLVIAGSYLSKRETDCLYPFVYGQTAKKIAELLGISTRTVEHYIESVKNKLGVSSKYELILKVMGNKD